MNQEFDNELIHQSANQFPQQLESIVPQSEIVSRESKKDKNNLRREREKEMKAFLCIYRIRKNAS